MTNIYDFSFKNSAGTALPLSTYQGKLLLLVNTASRCGFTSQYAGLQQLWEDYRMQGLVVLGVPTNDFGHQEPGTMKEILCFTRDHYAVTFPLTEKIHVKGPATHPCYNWLNNQLPFWAKPHWNFYKYLISPQGKLIAWFTPLTKPLRLRKFIELHLP